MRSNTNQTCTTRDNSHTLCTGVLNAVMSLGCSVIKVARIATELLTQGDRAAEWRGGAVKRALAAFAILLLTACSGGGGGNGTPPPSTNQPPSASFSFTPTTGPSPLIVDFDASGSRDNDGSIADFTWDFSDGNSASGATTQHSFKDSGTFTVRLTVTDNDGATNSTTQNITVDDPAPPVAVFTSSGTAIAPASISFDATGSTSTSSVITSHSWDFGDGSEGFGSIIDHVFQDSGTYTVTLTIETATGQEASESAELEIAEAIGTFSVTGTVSIPANVSVDNDVNNSFSPAVDNNLLANAQTVPSPTLLAGYLNQPGGGPDFDGLGNTWASGDLSDIFQFEAAGGEIINVTIANSELLDIDLFLLDDTGATLDQSLSLGQFETVRVPQDMPGTYFLAMDVFVPGPAGGSKYVLSIGDEVELGSAGWRTSAEFIPGELVVVESRNVSMASSTARMAVVTPGYSGPSLYQFGTNINAMVQATSTSARPPAGTLARHYRDPVQRAKYNTLAAAKTLQYTRQVSRAEPNYIHRSLLTPDDTVFNNQWHYQAINLPAAWDITVGKNDVVVAVIDSGVVTSHPDLDDRLTTDGFDFVSQATEFTSGQSGGSLDGDGIDDDPSDPGDACGVQQSSYHGTHVAGTVGAETDNNDGVAGVTWSGQIMALRALGACGSGSSFDIQQALLYAAGLPNSSGTVPAQTADVVNLSLGSEFSSASEQEIYAQVRDAGVIIVAAAGNSGIRGLEFPASYQGVISVSATSILDNLAAYSTFGPAVDVAAPGGDFSTPDIDGDGRVDGVLSTDANDAPGAPLATLEYKQGTSMAAPHVAGVIALMKGLHPELTPENVDTLLLSGLITDDLGDLGRDELFGNGRINALKAVLAAQQLANGGELEPVPLLQIRPAILNFGQLLNQLTVQVENGGTGELSITAVTSSDPFIEVTPPGSTDGLGAHTIAVDRDGLTPGIYTGSVAFESTESNSVLEVRFQVVDPSALVAGNAGVQFILVLEPVTFDVISNTNVSVQDGAYEFLLGTDITGMIAAGSYLLVSGSDPDNDGFICDIAEACGFFRSIDLPEEIAVNGDLIDLDFNVTYLLPIEQNSVQSSAIMSSIRSRGGIRLPRAKEAPMVSDDNLGN
ncbi:MAG: serine protease [OM182 bacterium MED-G24]|uniref:Serine protease n=1 Tax=OM182 bacterium MED-G24 TaxID=1986255 RepID=A0A2A5WW23_9GAMM|nr:MAG: serine protease [OM182 bacterium MED-G24]